MPCRGCLAPAADGEAGLCARCWEGLGPLEDGRCPRCALRHQDACPEPVAWELGDALWDYHGGRPQLGALLVPGIKAGEGGWRRALLDRAWAAPLPDWTPRADAVVPAPTLPFRRLLRGRDLAVDWAELLALRAGRPLLRLLDKSWRARAQTGRPESERRKLPRRAICVRDQDAAQGRALLLVDDVWTTGTTLLRCAQALHDAGAREVLVLTLFRATRG